MLMTRYSFEERSYFELWNLHMCAGVIANHTISRNSLSRYNNIEYNHSNGEQNDDIVTFSIIVVEHHTLHHFCWSFNAGCQAGLANCVNYTCGGINHWLPYQTYWGCCKGVIHDQRETYCSEIQGVMQCGTVAPAFRCRNEHCIPNPWLCNRVNDCQDGSDELGCDECNKTDNFRCWNGRCIPQSAVCDAYNDCGDGSDETFCRTLRGGWCTTKQYRCPTDSCVPLQNVCDGKADCTDNSDEIGCIVRKYRQNVLYLM